MHKKLIYTETAGILFTAAGCIFMRKLYAFSNYGLSGVLFGSVNSSVWEYAKSLFLPYLVWSVIELLCLGRCLKRFTSIKTAALCLILALYLPLSYLFVKTDTNGAAEIVISVLSVTAAQLFSIVIYQSPLKPERYFSVALCTLFLLLSFYFSFTPFPPDSPLFADRITGQRGIPPLGYDLDMNLTVSK
ncbi:MAG: DUF6512 family protein [Ruminococcus sp.]|nr:DUF6512 family protein [Ruminococcus sp.]